MIIGSAPDPALGNMIMLGLGGIYVEVFKDVAFGLNPLSAVDVRQMISSLKTKKLLTGVRGAAAADEEALVREVLRLALFLKDFPEIAEIDLNPVMVLPLGQGVRILDARIVLKS
jgi:acetyltransferase